MLGNPECSVGSTGIVFAFETSADSFYSGLPDFLITKPSKITFFLLSWKCSEIYITEIWILKQYNSG